MLALEGLKVLDMTRANPGAMCTMILGDLGAEVIKIEAPASLVGRATGLRRSPIGEANRRAVAFNALNRNKKSIALNLQTEAGREILCSLAKDADILVEGFRPGVTSRLGIDYAAVNKLNPRIIYCSLTGYGQTGPYAQLAGHDINYAAMGGALSLIGEKGAPPTIPLNLIADYGGAALHGVIGILAALAARERTQHGQYVDVSFTDSVISLLGFYTVSYFLNGTLLNRGETTFQGAYPYYAIYECSDKKFITLGCIEKQFWEACCVLIGREDLKTYSFVEEHCWEAPDPKVWGPIREALQDIFRTKTSNEWFTLLSEKGIPSGKVNDFREVFADPQVKARQMVVEIDDPKAGKISQIGHPIKLSATPAQIRTLAPLLGENTNEILLRLGYSPDTIAALRQAGSVQ